MARHLLAPVPDERPIELFGQATGGFDQCIDHGLGIFAGDLHQHYVARLPLDQGGDQAGLVAEQQVALPVAWNRAIFDRHRTLADRYGSSDPAVVVGLPGVMSRAMHGRVRRRCASRSFFSAPRDWMWSVR